MSYHSNYDACFYTSLHFKVVLCDALLVAKKTLFMNFISHKPEKATRALQSMVDAFEINV